MKKPRILIYDLEVSPLQTSTYSIWESNALWVDREWYLFSVSWKWLGEKRTHCKALTDYPNFKKDITDDKELVKLTWELLNEADIVIAHNADAFDNKKANARIAFYGMTPPAPYKTVDTLRVARRYFKFTSNRLDDLCQFLGIGEKMETPKGLAKRCVQGERKAFKIMKDYNKMDVIILENLYLKLLPWINNHPPRGTMEGRPDHCDNCGYDKMHQHTKKTYAKRGWKQQYKCPNCGAYKLGTKLHKFENFLE